MAVESPGDGIIARRVALALVAFYLAATVAIPLLGQRPALQLGHRHLFLNDSQGDDLSHSHDPSTADGIISLHEHPGQQEMVPSLSGQLALPAFALAPSLLGSLVSLSLLRCHCPVAVFLVPPDKPPI